MPWAFVVALSTAQLVSWGSIYYAFSLFIDPMSRDLGWSRPALTAAYSLGLFASGLGAVPVGRLIDLGHGRRVMTSGSLVAALLLALWSRIESYPAFVALWIGLGATMSAVLYEPGFAVLARRLGLLTRRGITVMTLVGGFASTVFIPLTHLFIEAFGWRGALVGLAATNLIFCGAVHALMIPGSSPKAASTAPPASAGARRVLQSAAFWSFVVTVILQGVVTTGVAIHLIPLLVERGFSLDAAVAAFSVIGPAQVAARMVAAFGERVLDLKAIGLITTGLSVLSFTLLPLIPGGSWLVIAFTALYGISGGMMTILRALLPPELFGRQDYGTIQGMIGAPATFARACGPFAFGALWAWWGSYSIVMGVWAAMAAGSLIAFAITLSTAKRA